MRAGGWQSRKFPYILLLKIEREIVRLNTQSMNQSFCL